MKLLLDECLPAALIENFMLLGRECQTVRQAGFGSKKNGELLTLAEGQWDVLVTSDRNISTNRT
jgi:predicted nuclease of predicted toxin-antitoxin system